MTEPAGSSPRRIRLNNAAAAVQHLYAAGPMSRAELARRLGLNRSSSGQIVAELTEGGLVREIEGRAPASGAGRPGILLELVPEAACFLGVEIGVEHVAAVTIDLGGRRVAEAQLGFDTRSTPVEEAVRRAVDLAVGTLPPALAERCRGLGLAAPAHIRPDGTVALAPLIGWRDLALVPLVAAALPRPMAVMIENDANAFAIGASYRHGATGVALFLILETGIGGGVLIEGKLFRGAHGLAGEIGHMLLPDGQELEALIGREALARRFSETGDFAAFLKAVRDREPRAVTIAEDWSRHLAHALGQACRLIDPDRVVLGGSVAALYPLVAARVAAHMARPGGVDFPAPQIVVDDAAEFGAAHGAACLLHQRFLTLADEALSLAEDEA